MVLHSLPRFVTGYSPRCPDPSGDRGHARCIPLIMIDFHLHWPPNVNQRGMVLPALTAGIETGAPASEGTRKRQVHRREGLMVGRRGRQKAGRVSRPGSEAQGEARGSGCALLPVWEKGCWR